MKCVQTSDAPAKKLSKVSFSVQKILAAADRIFEVIDRPLEIELEPARRKRRWPWRRPQRQIPDAGPPGLRLQGAVRFENVSFGYDPREPVLKHINLEVAPGEVVALVGPSGCGKSTLINLLLRFYDATSGRILLDGIPIEEIPLKTLRRHIGLVPQDVFLFSGTIRYNIAYASPEATDEEVEEAARAAGAHDFIMEFPEGYETPVGERGMQLSGGQRQRISIARALLHNPRMLIFDEAMSNLDSESEQLVQRALRQLARGRTVLMITHRLATLWRAGKIVVIDGGEIVEVGTHEELLATDGVYRRLYTLQLNPADATTPAALNR